MIERYNVQASTILGDNYKITNIECSDYNPSKGDTQVLNSNYTLTNTSSDYNTDANRIYGPAIGWANTAVGYVRNIKAEPL